MCCWWSITNVDIEGRDINLRIYTAWTAKDGGGKHIDFLTCRSFFYKLNLIALIIAREISYILLCPRIIWHTWKAFIFVSCTWISQIQSRPAKFLVDKNFSYVIDCWHLVYSCYTTSYEYASFLDIFRGVITEDFHRVFVNSIIRFNADAPWVVSSNMVAYIFFTVYP